MSSSLSSNGGATPPDTTPSGARFAGLSLRTRLTAAILILVAAVSSVIGVLTTLALRDFLLDQLDAQLHAAAQRATRAGGGAGPPPGAGGGPDRLLGLGQPVGTIGARVRAGSVEEAMLLDAGGVRQPIPPEQVSMLAELPADGRPYSMQLPTLDAYRLVASPMPDGSRLVTGLPLSGVTATVRRLVLTELGVAVIGLGLAGAGGTAIVGLSLRPLRRVAATASRVAQLRLDRGEVDLSVRVPYADARTEVGQVGSALNRMLDHVGEALASRQASVTRVRRFVADASHELRTPLAAIRGYAELPRRAGEAVPPDTAHALGRIESQAARMTTLVDDLLLLARLDSGRPLASEPVDLSRMIVDAVGDAHAAGPDHHWRLDLPEEAISVNGDAVRLHQVLANLLANARTHTPSGTMVTTTLATTGDGWARIRVHDNGPGIPAPAQREVFERFARADSGRARGAGGTGLGLSIVAAVVEAHHGWVAVTSRPGDTCFEVALPGAWVGNLA